MASQPRAHPRVARASRLNLPGNVSDINDYFDQQGWTDGLPIIPPTEDLVSTMLAASPVPAEQVLGRLPPRNGTMTVEKVAINAVMAGCRPDYFPVVLAAVKAVLQPQFNAGAITTTTGGAAPVVVVSGPIAGRLGIHSGTAVLGSGHRANATIGRALRLTMRNLGGPPLTRWRSRPTAGPASTPCALRNTPSGTPGSCSTWSWALHRTSASRRLASPQHGGVNLRSWPGRRLRISRGGTRAWHRNSSSHHPCAGRRETSEQH
jgi:hypothetical protein